MKTFMIWIELENFTDRIWNEFLFLYSSITCRYSSAFKMIYFVSYHLITKLYLQSHMTWDAQNFNILVSLTNVTRALT